MPPSIARATRLFAAPWSTLYTDANGPLPTLPNVMLPNERRETISPVSPSRAYCMVAPLSGAREAVPALPMVALTRADGTDAEGFSNETRRPRRSTVARDLRRGRKRAGPAHRR